MHRKFSGKIELRLNTCLFINLTKECTLPLFASET